MKKNKKRISTHLELAKKIRGTVRPRSAVIEDEKHKSQRRSNSKKLWKEEVKDAL